MSRNDNGRSLNMVSSNGNGEGQQATARHFTDAEVERNVSEIVNKVKSTTNEMDAMRSARRDGGSAKTDAVDAAVEGVARDVADWRKTECVIEGPDAEGLCRIRHAPSDRAWSKMGSCFLNSHCSERYNTFGFYYEPSVVHAVLASIPDSARPIVAAPIAPPHVPVIEQGTNGLWRAKLGNTVLSCLCGWVPESYVIDCGFTFQDQDEAEYILGRSLSEGIASSDAAARPAPQTFVGNELHNVEVARPVERQCRRHGAVICQECHHNELSGEPCTCADCRASSNVRPVSEPEQAELDETLDKFGIANPQAGEGAPLAPSPASLDRETAEAFFRAGYSAAMNAAVVIIHKHFISSMARAAATIDLAERGSNPPSSKGVQS